MSADAAPSRHHPREPAGRDVDVLATDPSLDVGRPVDRSSGQSAPRQQPTHLHVWRLPDGTGLHAPLGYLSRHPETGEAACHLCGRWFRALGAHVRVHGLSAAEYRTTFGLCKGRALAAPDVSAAIALRQRRRYWSDPEVQARFEPGQRLAKTGELAARAHAASHRVAPEYVQIRSRALDAGRATTAIRRDADLSSRLATLGAPSLGAYLRAAHARGDSLEALARATGLGRGRLRAAMTEAGITPRPPGINSAEGKRSRARTADALAAARVGTDDLEAWLRERHVAGWTLRSLAEAVGHSPHWVQWRLDRPAPTPAAPAGPVLH